MNSPRWRQSACVRWLVDLCFQALIRKPWSQSSRRQQFTAPWRSQFGSVHPGLLRQGVAERQTVYRWTGCVKLSPPSKSAARDPSHPLREGGRTHVLIRVCFQMGTNERSLLRFLRKIVMPAYSSPALPAQIVCPVPPRASSYAWLIHDRCRMFCRKLVDRAVPFLPRWSIVER